MRKFVLTTAFLAMTGVPAALAQGAGTSSGSPSGGGLGNSATSPSSANPTVPPALSPDSRVIGTAPVGHRQPKAADVPPTADQARIDAEDRALDRKIRSICRGC